MELLLNLRFRKRLGELRVLCAFFLILGWITCSAQIQRPRWCPPETKNLFFEVDAIRLIETARALAQRGQDHEAIVQLCEAYGRTDVQANSYLAGNIANYTGTILFRGPGQLGAAGAAFADALKHFDPKVHISEVATAHANIGNVHHRQGAINDAEKQLRIAGKEASRILDADLQASVLATIIVKEGLVAEAKGQLDIAASKYKAAYEQALHVSANASTNIRASARASIAEAMHNLASIQSARGHYSEAIRQLLDLRSWSRKNINVVADYWTTYTLLTTYQALERHREALALVPELDALQQKSPDAGLRASTQMAIAKSLYALRNLDAAMPRLLEAAKYFSEQGMASELAQALNSMGVLALDKKRIAEAEQAFSRSLSLRRTIGDRVGEGITLQALANLAWRIGQTDKAHQLLGQAVDILEKEPSPITYALALGSYAVSLVDRNQKREAKEILEKAVDLLWRYRSVGKSLTLARNENDRVRPVYDALIALYLEEKNSFRALEIAELVRAASVRTETAVDPTTSIDSTGEERIPALEVARNRVFTAMRVRQSAPSATSEANLAAALRDLDTAVVNLELSKKMTTLKSVGFATIVQTLQTALGNSRALLMYYKMDTHWTVWVITDKAVTSVMLATSPEKISDLLNAFRLFSWDSGGVPPQLRTLYTALLEPVRHLVEGRDIIVVPSAELNMVPFAALHDGTKYLIQKATVSHALGIGHATQLLTTGQGKPFSAALLLATADSPGFTSIAHTETEVKSVAAHLRSPTVRIRASVDDFFSLAPEAGIIHVAAHGVVDFDQPLLSRLALIPAGAQDGLLSVADIRRTVLKRRPLVVLSACETGVGAIGSDEAVHGLAGAFFHAGASSVVSTLWLVDDASSATLMSIFYKHLMQEQKPAAALRSAMLQIMALKSHPYYWAAYTYVGIP